MSEEVPCESVQYILNEYELCDQSQDSIIYPDGSKAVLVNGHILQADDDTFILNEDGLDHIFITDSPDTPQQIFQYINGDDENISSEQSHILFVQDQPILRGEESSESFGVNEILTYETECLNIDDIVTFQQEDISDIVYPQNAFQCAVIKDGMLHIQSFEEQHLPVISLNNEIEYKPDPPVIESNRLTSQCVVRDINLGKIKKAKTKNISDSVCRRQDILNSLLNKKVKLGKTINGKQLMAKIIEVRHKNYQNEKSIEIENESSIQRVLGSLEVSRSVEESPGIIHVPNLQNNSKGKNKSKVVPKDSLELVSNILEGIVNMENVKDKWMNCNVIVKVLDKQWDINTQTFKKSSYYLNGYVCDNTGNIRNDESNLWTFVHNKEELQNMKRMENVKSKNDVERSPNTAQVTIIIASDKNGNRKVKLIFDDLECFKCSLCMSQFQTKVELKSHMKICHDMSAKNNRKKKSLECLKISEKESSDILAVVNSENDRSKMISNLHCQICCCSFDNEKSFQLHLKVHSEERDSHDVHNDNCSSNLKANKGIDLTSKYTCHICNRSFTRNSNLQRHTAIHKEKDTMYECSICNCSFHYISSLTRHVVQHHVDV